MSRIRLFGAYTLLALSCTATVLPARSDETSSAYERGRRQMERRDYEGALNSFGEAIGFNMTDSQAYFMRGQTFYKMRSYDQALADFQHFAEMKPNDAQAYIWIGTVEARMGHHQRAIDNYVKAMNLDHNLVSNYEQSAGSASETKAANPNNQGAVEDYKEAVRIYLGNAGGVTTTKSTTVVSRTTELSDIAPSGLNKSSDVNDKELRIEELNAALRDDPSNASLYYKRGRVNKRLGKFDRALSDYSQAIQLNPMIADYYLARGQLYYEQKQQSLADADIQKAYSVDPRLPRGFRYTEASSGGR